MKIILFQQFDSARKKIEGVTQYGKNIKIDRIISIDIHLPEFIDNPEEYIDSDFQADLVLNYCVHPDLSEHLMRLCEQKKIAIISAGKKGPGFTPFTCCGLGNHKKLGKYGSQFGLPEYKIELVKGRIQKIEVTRGAPCGATWDALENYIGMSREEALIALPRQVQYFCVADPSKFDPVTGKSSVHYAGHVHTAALKKALSESEK